MDVSSREELVAGPPVGVNVLVPVVAVDLLVVLAVVPASILAAGPNRVAPVVTSALAVSAFSAEGQTLRAEATDRVRLAVNKFLGVVAVRVVAVVVVVAAVVLRVAADVVGVVVVGLAAAVVVV